MWDPPRPGLEPVSPALAGRLSTTAPPGKPWSWSFLIFSFFTWYLSIVFTTAFDTSFRLGFYGTTFSWFPPPLNTSFRLCSLIFLRLGIKRSSSSRVSLGPSYSARALSPSLCLSLSLSLSLSVSLCLSLSNLIYTASVSTYVRMSHEIISPRPF